MEQLLRDAMDESSFGKLAALKNDAVCAYVAEAIALCTPAAVLVCDDSPEDAARIRQQAIAGGEEIPLALAGHTVHFDGYYDQARRKEVTRYLVPKGRTLDPKLNQVDRDEGMAEIRALQRGAYAGRTMYVRFCCLGPEHSPFSIPCVQITDSAYVVHSEDLLYRNGYAQLLQLPAGEEFFKFRHASGEVDERMTSKHPDKNRVYIDYTENQVLSVNTQYAGNTVGLKKLALRLAILKADREGWLAEHMFIMRVSGPGGRGAYFCGAFPSGCGKTSTAMLPGEHIVGDDLAYFRVLDGAFRAANVESGIFGIIRDVNAQDDPEIFRLLHQPGEVIFGNVLVEDGRPYWLGMGEALPKRGMNHVSVDWHEGMPGPDGQPTTASHKNARYTIALKDLDNRDPAWDDPQGVPVSGIIYGGRDSDTSVPVQEAYSWEHGICTMGAMLESETTAATIGQEGVRKFNVMSNMDFLSMSIGRYIRNNLEFARSIPRPKVFGTNYFLKKDGAFLNGKLDKGIWIKWMELRVHGDVGALDAPTGRIPKYEDLRDLFRTYRDRDYGEQAYIDQFTIRIPECLAKLDRMAAIYATVADTPPQMLAEMQAQRERLEALCAVKGTYVSPADLP